MRIHVIQKPGLRDGRALRLREDLLIAGLPVADVRLADIYIVDGIPAVSAEVTFFRDEVAQTVLSPDDRFYSLPWTLLIEVTYRPGVADPVATSIRDALGAQFGPLPGEAVVQTARQIILVLDAGSGAAALAPRIAGSLHNPLVQQATILTREEWDNGARPPEVYPVVTSHDIPPTERLDIASMDDDELQQLSRDRLLALSLEEMRAVRDYYRDVEVSTRRQEIDLGTTATDVELEMIAQTWSEHCKHKIFAARISYTDTSGEDVANGPATAATTEDIDGLFRTYIRDTTRKVAPDDRYVKSVFDDNAGVVAFDDETLICFKAETHNSPSALDPYGGAITGIVGVNRDILGTGKGARPIFNTDVLCFGRPDTPAESLPEGLLHPRTVLSGVHRGIVDGGNQSGIPVAAGGFLFDQSYIGKPLVFCGTGGILPARIDGEASWIKHTNAGDLAVMVGGRIGKDGIHGATFSSLGLDESSPTSAVQIGEPITQRKMADFLLEARDAGLYCGITDNGAGGLSSSLGEMAQESGGIEIDLDACPLKYGGLAAWEILVSESQERMSLSVSPDTIDDLLDLARRRGVETTVVGTFTDDGCVRVTHQGDLVAQIDLDFLHNGLPQMHLVAEWPGAPTPGATANPVAAAKPGAASANPGALHATLLALLSNPNIASKESLVRQYDHEVQGGSIVKPSCGVCADGPTDGAVLKPRYDSWRGITVTHGINPRFGDVDTYHMATASVDEAVRAHVALGGDPDRMAALDNFCWPDPVLSDSTPDGPFKLAQLVRACRGLADACEAYGLPLISGKDSMKNDSYLGGRKVSIRPTLLVSLTGIVPDVRRAMRSAFRSAGDRILLIGTGSPDPACPKTDLGANRAFYRAMHRAMGQNLCRSVHDVSDGGVLTAVAESAIGGRLGARINIPRAEPAPAAAPAAGNGERASEAPGDAATPGEPGAAAAPPVAALPNDNLFTELFGERTGTFVATCAPGSVERLTELLLGDGDSAVNVIDLGEVTAEDSLSLTAGVETVSWTMDELVTAWDGLRRMLGGEGAVPAGTSPARSASPASGAVPDAGGKTAGGAKAAAAAAAQGGGPPRRAVNAGPVAMLLTGYGINAERELAEAFRLAGAYPRMVHLNDLLANPGLLDAASIFALPGGFSYGDHVGSGLMLAHRLGALQSTLDDFRNSGRLILGICNGFQVLTKMGILPDLAGGWRQEVSLIHNHSGLFEDSWVSLDVDASGGSPWLSGLECFDAPVRHGEGCFVTGTPEILDQLRAEKRIALRYAGRNPNGSVDDIAGIVDRTGCVLGMMPHPEAFLCAAGHPMRATCEHSDAMTEAAAEHAAHLFRNAVRHVTAV